MPNGMLNQAMARGARRVPGLKRVAMLKLLAAAEIALLARDHIDRLDVHDRRRILHLVRQAHGRPSNLSPRQRDELRELVAKAEPRLFLGLAADKVSPVPLPKRFVEGARRAR